MAQEKYTNNSTDMVCLDEEKIQCTVYDTSPLSKQKKIVFSCRPTYKVENLFTDVARAFSYDDSFCLFLSLNDENLIPLDDKKNLTLNEIPGFVRGNKNKIYLKDKNDSSQISLKGKQTSTKRVKTITKSVKKQNDTDIAHELFPLSQLTPSPPPISPISSIIETKTTPTPTITSNNSINNWELTPVTSTMTTAITTTTLPSSSPSSSPSEIPSSSTKTKNMFFYDNGDLSTTTTTTTENKTICKLKLESQSMKPNAGYVGLVNQAMTCYLNSLLQALFMTPEFRNALYKMKFDEKDEKDTKSIPFQLQKLFVNLQTSNKMAVETTDLTKSFGWDSSQAWTQHDIQELCRVMFDALEKEFQRTKQENWINKYYEGKMIDYVKCLECGIEKTREDTFLDIPLPLRPFGSNRAYESVEEALRAFVQPEILDGQNQYFCEKCNKKCDAHKGLKFLDFSYILTLHLKRFDFDYQTFHRIKLNDRVTFPQTLNLNCFLNATDTETFSNLKNNNGNHTTQLIMNGGLISSSVSSESESICTTKFDDCSTTDSGAILEEDNCNGGGTITSTSSHHENEDDDEGIEMSTSSGGIISSVSSSTSSNTSGPYIYELFSIMVHSGSASGGHYYAYIKDFDTGEWYCFNDQTVSPITQDDIQKSFGGESYRPYYSSIYSSSTNAYMLMYRRIDSEQNEKAIKINEFPDHILKLQQLINDNEQEEKKRRTENEILKPKVYFYNKKLKCMKDCKVYVTRTSSLENTLEVAYGLLKIQQQFNIPIEQCRLVAYDPTSEKIEMSLTGQENDNIEDVLRPLCSSHFLLETRDIDEKFDEYEFSIDAITLKSYKIDLNTLEFDGPLLIRTQLKQQQQQQQQNINNLDNNIEEQLNINEIKKMLSKRTKINYDSLIIKLSLPSQNSNLFHPHHIILFANLDEFNLKQQQQQQQQQKQNKKEIAENILKNLSKDCPYITYIYCTVPPTDKKSLDNLCIPQYEPSNDISIEEDEENKNDNYVISPSTFKNKNSNNDIVDAVSSSTIYFNFDKIGDTKISKLERNVNNKSCKQQQLRISSPLPSSTLSSTGTSTTTTTTESSTTTATTITNSTPTIGIGEQIESEDSSLSDGDRTLVESVPYNINESSNESSPSRRSPQLSSPDDENYSDGSIDGDLAYTINEDNKINNKNKCKSFKDQKDKQKNLYFYATEIINDQQELSTTSSSSSSYNYQSLNNHNNSLTNGTISKNHKGDGDNDDSKSSSIVSDTAVSESTTTKTSNLSISDNDIRKKSRLFKIFVDTRMSILNFQLNLQSIIGVSAKHFKLSTLCRSNDKCNFRENEQITIELERRIKTHEVKIKIYYLKLSKLNDFTGKFLPISQYFLSILKTLKEIKLELIEHIKNVYPNEYKTLNINNCRLWRKWGKNPETILNEQGWESDLKLCRTNCELVIQECEPHANMNTTDDTLTLFVRRWDPANLKLGGFDEITLERKTDIKSALAAISGIKEENIAYAIAGNTVFPFNDISVLEVRKFDWHKESATKSNCILNKCENGNLCIYKNIEENDATLTEKEEFEIKMQERKRIDANCGRTSLLSPRKEHALKIYLNSSPKTIED